MLYTAAMLFTVPHVPSITLMIPIYTQNVAMEATIPAKWIDEQRPKLIEGRLYTIQYFEVCNARGMYRPVDHPYSSLHQTHQDQ